MSVSVQFHYDENTLPQWKVFVTGVKNCDEAKDMFCRLFDKIDASDHYTIYNVTAKDIHGGILFEIVPEEK